MGLLILGLSLFYGKSIFAANEYVEFIGTNADDYESYIVDLSFFWTPMPFGNGKKIPCHFYGKIFHLINISNSSNRDQGRNSSVSNATKECQRELGLSDDESLLLKVIHERNTITQKRKLYSVCNQAKKIGRKIQEAWRMKKNSGENGSGRQP